MLRPRVLYPFLVILALMFLLQFSGQGAMTFYTSLIFREAQQTGVEPNDASVVVGITYLMSSVVALVLKKHVGRRLLLLASELLMGAAQLSLGFYFYMLKINHNRIVCHRLDV